MSKRHRQLTQEAKRRRAQTRRPAAWRSLIPYAAVGGVALVAVLVLFLVTVGGGSNSTAAAYPIGYVPPTRGAPDAPVEFVMWEDFQCPFCRRFTLETVRELDARYVETGKMRFVWRNFQRYGQESTGATVAAYCAGEQGKFWEYHESLFAHQRGIQAGSFTPPNLQTFAQDLALDMAAFNVRVNDGDQYRQVMRADLAVARSQKISGTPSFFINERLVVGAQPTETFVALIEQALREAGR